MVQLNPVPVFGAKKNTSTTWRKIFTEISVQVVSAQDMYDDLYYLHIHKKNYFN